MRRRIGSDPSESWQSGSFRIPQARLPAFDEGSVLHRGSVPVHLTPKKVNQTLSPDWPSSGWQTCLYC